MCINTGKAHIHAHWWPKWARCVCALCVGKFACQRPNQTDRPTQTRIELHSRRAATACTHMGPVGAQVRVQRAHFVLNLEFKFLKFIYSYSDQKWTHTHRARLCAVLLWTRPHLRLAPTRSERASERGLQKVAFVCVRNFPPRHKAGPDC